MPVFKLDANNDMQVSDLFAKRVLYQFYAYAGLDGIPGNTVGVQDYWRLERSFYGKVDPNFNCVEVHTGALSQISSTKGHILVIDIVGAAFKKFQSYFTIPLRLGKIANGTPISSPMPYRGFSNPLVKYQEYALGVVEEYNNYLFRTQKYYKILNVGDYVRSFFKYYLSSPRLLTKSSFYMSTRCSQFSSGMIIDIADLDPSDDSAKEAFIASPNFSFYRQAAINAGFLIDKNIPWRLHFDLRSPVVIEEYGSGIASNTSYASEFFATKFTFAHLDDVPLLKSLLNRGYGLFFNALPKLESSSPKRRQVPTETAVASQFPDIYWVQKYAEVKNAENDAPFVPQDFARLKTNAQNLLSISRAKAHSYIYQKFKMPWISPNSLFYEKLRREFKEKGDFSLDKFSEYVKMVVMNSISSMY